MEEAIEVMTGLPVGRGVMAVETSALRATDIVPERDVVEFILG